MTSELKPKCWYVLYTKPRWEKKVHLLMLRSGYESYCPLTKVRRKWSDRYKLVEEPLFKSYLFVYLAEDQKSKVRFVDGVVNFVYWLGKPVKLKEDEIVRIKRFLNEYEDVKLVINELPKVGDKVIITNGSLMEHQGMVLSTSKKRVQVRIDSLGCKLVAFVEIENVSIKS